MRGPSSVAGGRSRLMNEPARVGRPATSNRFFTAKGTPASGPVGLVAARARARSATMSVKALSVPSWRAMRSSAACTVAVAVVRPVVTSAAMAAAVGQVMRGIPGWIQKVWQGWVGQRGGLGEDGAQVEGDAGLPRRVDGQAHEGGAGADEVGDGGRGEVGAPAARGR